MFSRMILDLCEALAERAESLHLELVSEDPVVHGPARLLLEARVDGHRKVIDPAAAEAADVIVPPGVAVEARRMASRMDLADDSLLRHLRGRRAASRRARSSRGLDAHALARRVHEMHLSRRLAGRG